MIFLYERIGNVIESLGNPTNRQGFLTLASEKTVSGIQYCNLCNLFMGIPILIGLELRRSLDNCTGLPQNLEQRKRPSIHKVNTSCSSNLFNKYGLSTQISRLRSGAGRVEAVFLYASSEVASNQTKQL